MSRTKHLKRAAALALCLGLLLALCACADPNTPAGYEQPQSQATPDPHAGMVEVTDGSGGTMWVYPAEGVPLSAFAESDFALGEDGWMEYVGADDALSIRRGIDVSAHQEEIDWAAVRGAGVDFAMIRAGYRGYTEGGLFEDEYFRYNVEQARANGIDVGVYFFSQAITEEEAEEEADYVLSLLEGLDVNLPVAFDWERMGAGETARTDSVGGTLLTDMCLAFCARIREAGYDPCLYLYLDIGYYSYELSRLTELPLWLGDPGGWPEFRYDCDIWQYSFSGAVAGIGPEVDMDIMFVREGES